VEAPAAPPVEPQPKTEAPAPAVERQAKVEVAPLPKAEAPAPAADPQPGQVAAAPPPEPTSKTAAAPPSAPAAAPQTQAKACQDDLGRIAGAGRILFDSDSATLDASSVGTLDRLAAAAKLCPGVRIAIEGHADVEGSAEYNRRLSVRRAQAVVAYLIKAGADARQLEAVGFGSSRPVAPNDSAGNKAKNRRIEIVVRQ
jgi:outer membrane protein OmpA-like peptidoglycan-associated protein